MSEIKIMQIRHHQKNILHNIADLHINSIYHGVLPLLGKDFLSELYSCIADSLMSGIWVIMADGCLVGFIAGCADRGNLHNSILRKHGLSLLKYAFPRLLRFSVIKKIILMGLESFNIISSNSFFSPHAELLSIAVDQKYTRKGYATLLLMAFEKQLLKWNIKEYIVLTNTKEVNSNAFYIAKKFNLVGTKKHHSLVLNIYKKKLGVAG